MNILVIGSGGREHALCWKIAQSPLCQKLYVAPGNSGMRDIAEQLPIASNDNQGLLEAAQRLNIDLTVVGPDDVLASGLVDLFTAHGLTAFGPTQAAAQLEWSKEFSKGFMQRHNIPTASWHACSGREEALAALQKYSYPVFIKASGLALGKGAIMAHNQSEAEQAITDLHNLGQAGATLIIEEYLEGREMTLLAFCDGKTIVPLLPSEDHKQLLDFDQGPNTGGMGAIAPVSWLNEEQMRRIEDEVIAPTLQGIQQEGLDFRGVIYFGLMITAAGPKVIEYNARFGDPEAQVVLPMLRSDLVPIMLACCRGELTPSLVEHHQGAAACVVLASPGYPATSTKGLAISGLDTLDPEIIPFYAGFRYENNQPQTNGGRVLALTARAEQPEETLRLVYRNVAKVSFPGMQYRKDIGQRR